MYRSWLTGWLAEWQIRYNRPPYEPTFYVYEGLVIDEAKAEMTKITCPDGTTADQAKTVTPPDPSRALIAIAHWHQGYGFGEGIGHHSPWPGVGDGLVVQRRGIPNYVFADAGLTVVRPGPNNTVAGIDILGNNGLPPGGPPTPANVTMVSTGKSAGANQCQ